jgi:hypothetical protein
MQLIIEGVSLAVALVTQYLKSRGMNVTPEQIAANSRRYIQAGLGRLNKSQAEYLSDFQDGVAVPGGGSVDGPED